MSAQDDHGQCTVFSPWFVHLNPRDVHTVPPLEKPGKNHFMPLENPGKIFLQCCMNPAITSWVNKD